MRAAVVAITLAVLAAPAAGQDGIPAGGTDILRGLLKYQGFTPRPQPDADPANTLVVVVGRTNLPPDVAAQIAGGVLARGGALLIVTDQPGGVGRLFPRFAGATVSAAGVRCDDPAGCFGGDPDAPLAQLRAGDPTGVGAFNVGGPLALTTGRPHALELDDDGVLNTEVARFPAGCRYADRAADGRRFRPLLAVRSDPARPYTALLYADRAMFSNGLMTAAAPDGKRATNFVYTFLLTKFLADRLDGRGPKACYFVEDGVVNTDFDQVSFVAGPQKLPGGLPPGGLPPGGLPPIPLPLLADKAFDMANGAINRAEEKDIPNVFQQNDPRNRVQDGVLFALAIFASVVLVRYVLARGWGLRTTPEVVPRLRIDPDRGGGLIPERRLGLLESGNLYEPLRDHLRFVFARWGVTNPDPGQLPNIAVDRKTRPIGRIVADLRRLWYLAYQPDRADVSPIDLEEFEDMIADLAHAHDKGIWRFAIGGAA